MIDPQDRALVQKLLQNGVIRPDTVAEIAKELDRRLRAGETATLRDILSQKGLTLPSDRTEFLPQDSPLPSGKTVVLSGDSPLPSGKTVVLSGDSPLPSGDTVVLSQDSPAGAGTGEKPGKVSSAEERYRKLEELGRGGMGIVYRALDRQLQRQVALKVLLDAGPLADEKDLKRFYNEAAAIARLDHPHIVKVYDCDPERQCFAMEFVEGETLEDYLKGGARPLPQLLDILGKVGEAVHYAHERQIIHRDLKPANIMLDRRLEPKVMDFGLAMAADAGDRMTRTGQAVGTLAYMPPEQAMGRRREIDRRSDVYAMGAVLYEMLTGRPPFIGDSERRLFRQIKEDVPVSPRKVRPGVGRDIATICLKALEKKRERRYRTAMEMVEDLRRFGDGRPVLAAPSSLLRRMHYGLRRNRKIATASLLALLALTLALWLPVAVQSWKRDRYVREVLAHADEFSKRAPLASHLNAAHPRPFPHSEPSFQELANRKQAIEEYQPILGDLRRAALLSPGNRDISSRLQRLAKECGDIGVGGRNYLLGEFYYRMCGEKTGALRSLEIEKHKLREAQQRRVHDIMEELAQNIPEEGMPDEYVTEIARMDSSYTVEVLLPYIEAQNRWQRRVAIEAAGKIGERGKEVQGRDPVEWLAGRLQKIDAGQNPDEAEQLIWALGRLRDGRAYAGVDKTRREIGPNSDLWLKTQVPFGWIPVPDQLKRSRELRGR